MQEELIKLLQKQFKNSILLEFLANLSPDKLTAILEPGKQIASISLKASIEYFFACQELAKLLDAEAIRLWSETGKRLASHSSDAAVEFFRNSQQQLASIDPAFRKRMLVLLSKQAGLSASMPIESLYFLPTNLRLIEDKNIADELLTIATEVSNYSVKHGFELSKQAAKIAAFLQDPATTLDVLRLARAFANKAGSSAAEFLLLLPQLTQHSLTLWPQLLEYTACFLERSGGLALQYFRAGSLVVEFISSKAFDLWTYFGLQLAAQSNPTAYQFFKQSPRILKQLSNHEQSNRVIETVLKTVLDVGQVNLTAAVECFKVSPQALRLASPQKFHEWALNGKKLVSEPLRMQAYYLLESQASLNALQNDKATVLLENIAQILRLYIEGLTGRSVQLRPVSEMNYEQKLSDGKTIFLPAAINEFADETSNFKLYKALAAHAAGQLEFKTFETDSPALLAIDIEIAECYADERQLPHRNFLTILTRFPEQRVSRRIFTAIENGRIDRHLRHNYRGIRRELDFVKEQLLKTRPRLEELPTELVPYELLFRCATFGNTGNDARELFPFAQEFDNIFEQYVNHKSTVADSLKATMLIYDLIEKIKEGEAAGVEAEQIDRQSRQEDRRIDDATAEASIENAEVKQIEGPFSYWLAEADDGQHDTVLPSQFELQERPLEAGETAYYYDEWDRDLADYRVQWCRVIEKRLSGNTTEFVDATKAKYAGIISSIKYQFQLLRPESLLKIRGELDGEDFDLQAIVDYAVDRRSSGRIDERLYIKRLRKQRDVAVSFLLDMSSSTARIVSRQHLPYSKPGQRIIEIEKEGLVLMAEALEAVGDSYSILGFTSEGRKNVRIYVVKDFDEKYSTEVAKRIGAVTYHNNTRLGAAIRHATARLERQPAHTKLLIVLSDGRPYDHDYGDSRYAREDTKIALMQAKAAKITPFCITIDRDFEQHLVELYGEVGFTIIDNVLSLPERLPGIYKRLTT
ncbi:MAG: VWA domain-containing protein [Acidobacteriota bacterium]|nr:VWA domain-containing protein [Blastocatellia bacterium]MDW8413466.1 VWA domain-containing protein [Acidobacteriota bacterium]